MSTHPLDELADFAKGGGRKENHGAPLIRLLFPYDIKLIPVSVVTSACEFLPTEAIVNIQKTRA